MTILLVCANCEDVIRDLGPVDLVLADPPFGISNKRNVNIPGNWIGYTSYKGDWDIGQGAFWVNECVRALRSGGLFASFGVYGSLVPIYLELEHTGMKFQNHVVWEKAHYPPSIHRRMYTMANEFILIYSKGSKWTFHYWDAKELNDDKQMHNVWRAGSPRRVLGRTRKPDDVLDRLILPLTNEDDWLLDPFCGTCSIVERAAFHNVNVIGIDNDPEVIEYSYYDLTNKGYEVVML